MLGWVDSLAFLRGVCTPACFRDGGASCWHKNTIIRRQLLTGKWMLENKKGYIRLADEHMIIFDEEEYIKHKNSNLNNNNGDMANKDAILRLMEKYNHDR